MWNFWIDRGGTFTDIAAVDPNGKIITKKLLSDSQHYKDAACFGIKQFLHLAEDDPILSNSIAAIKMGTTVATNALLEHQGEPVLLAITAGFKDALQIAYQNRPDIFALQIKLPLKLYKNVIEIDERIDATGKVITELDLIHAKQNLQQQFDLGFRSIAIVLMHSYRNNQHEKLLKQVANEIGFTTIAISHELNALIKLISRGDTAVLEAYLSPKLKQYINQIRSQFNNTPLYFMQSNGGLVHADAFRAKDSILSGPAGGLIGAIKVAELAGIKKIISFDMGGTSTDVAHYDGELERKTQINIAGVNLTAPTLQIHTVAAGGGSILEFKLERFQVGPESAGANPGPACYRNNGPLTVTDANVLLGRIQAKYFPKTFGKNAEDPLDTDSVVNKFLLFTNKINNILGTVFTSEEVAIGFLKVAINNMANAIKKISVERGYDVTEDTLLSFGGAGAQHACDVADELGIETILLHPGAGVLSAYGIGQAELRMIEEQTIEVPFNKVELKKLKPLLQQLKDKAKKKLLTQNASLKNIEIQSRLRLRYQGNEAAVEIIITELQPMQQQFELEFKLHYGYLMSDNVITIEAIVIEAIGYMQQVSFALKNEKSANQALKAVETIKMYDGQDIKDTPVYLREQIPYAEIIYGPALIIEKDSTIVITKDWEAERNPDQNLIVRRHQKRKNELNIETKVDPVMLEVFNNLFMSIAEQMGVALQKTAYSINVKERLDYSCAVFDREGHLIANAPHIPVHLGSMGESVRAVIKDQKIKLKSGDVYMLNNPYQGGTHLPDITVITPLFFSELNKPTFYVASRAHHADIGGITPGSIPASSRHIDEEGLLIENFLLVENGRFLEDNVYNLLTTAKYPARNPNQNIADLKAQVSANQKGIFELNKMIQHFSLPVVQAYTQHVQDNAALAVKKVLKNLSNCKFRYAMDNGAEINVEIRVNQQKQEATIDFTGSSDMQSNNFNAPKAVCIAAVLYVFRTLVGEKIPLNEGCLRPLNIIIPAKSILNPIYPSAVVAGNVETSQVIVDTLYGALQIIAASQGTMNNLTFGNDRYQYYETICGGSGAGKSFAGTSAVHTHMTNSLLTDPEVFESRFPVRIEDFSIRHGSGGKGKYQGGDGVIRKLLFLEAMQGAIVSNHRKVAPFGLLGGEAGQAGKNYIQRKNGTVELLGATAEFSLEAGDRLIIETPGGGGYFNL